MVDLRTNILEKKYKIALVTYSLSSGGLERIVSNLSVLLGGINTEIHIHVLNSAVDYPYSGQLVVYALDQKNFLKKAQTYNTIKNRIKVENYDCILDHRYRLNPFTEFFWQKIIYKNEKVYNFIHSSAVYDYIFRNLKMNRWLFGSKRFIGVSEGITSIVRAAYPDLKIRTLYNAVSVRASGYNPIGGKYIATIARMDEANVKQVDVLLECFAQSMFAKMGFKLVIIGDGPRMEFMKSYARKLDIADLVVFTGFLINPYAYLENAYCTVLTSKYEGLPTVLIESLMLCTPVISFDCKTGPDEIIEPFQNGLLVENQNKQAFIKAMDRLADHTELYHLLKTNAAKSVSKFSKEEITQQWKELLSGRY